MTNVPVIILVYIHFQLFPREPWSRPLGQQEPFAARHPHRVLQAACAAAAVRGDGHEGLGRAGARQD